MEDSAGYERRAYQRNGSERGHLITPLETIAAQMDAGTP